ncbi:hypothetical protein R5R35_010298 [Gryllus longicercus]|uniref:Uncharacterized protein n=1 Tax=Gryllus longicercus TaxID=2509291 RepID=A0AAN9VFX5_9ORTH
MSAEEEASAPAAGPAPAARAPTAGAEAEAEAAAEAVPHLRRLSLPGDFPSGAVRHYHVHEHHYHVWSEHGCCGGGAEAGPAWPAPWQMWQPRHARRGKRAPCCSHSGAWAPPWVFDVAPWGKGAGRFSLAGGLFFLVAMAVCRGVVWLVRVHRPQPMLE